MPAGSLRQNLPIRMNAYLIGKSPATTAAGRPIEVRQESTRQGDSIAELNVSLLLFALWGDRRFFQ